ncbi:MAG: MFS transporter [Deltaproteobacteria bacterium]|nr:MFS transporter [Deltaproteobacteria bacterium]MBW2053125.1 MFS transporter [Deltaproteobacteria bacterium]MBW2141898.1 MFS transporter [Deltaproteobacteria bacterium]MBW2323501.1 MFS transporter [Deltaproteobacteria bacterium]
METTSKFRGQSLYAILLLASINLFLFADQNLMAPNLTRIAQDFGFSEVERDIKLGGNISFVFWVLGGVISLSIGYLTDMVSRRKLFLIVILIGEIPCLLSGFAQTYGQLFWFRALTGIGIGGALPLTFSLVGDYFPHHQRAAAAGYLGLAMGVGIALGQLLAGMIGPSLGWRLPFIIVAIPNFLLGILFWLTVKEPERGRTEESLKELIEKGQVYTRRINWGEYKNIFKVKTNLLIFLQGIPGTVPWGVFFIFLNDFYSQDKGYSVEKATLIVMAVGLAAIIGGFLGGLIGNKLYNLKPSYLPILCGATTLAGIIPMAVLINYPPQFGVENPSIVLPVIIGLFTGFIVTITSPNVKAMLLNANSPETRGSIFSLFNLADDLGKGFGPVVISFLIVLFGRVWAFNIANLFWLFCGLVLLYLAVVFPHDKEALEEVMEQRAKTMIS